MPTEVPAGKDGSRARVKVAAAVLLLIALLVASLAWVWYPTTLQPDVALTYTPFVATRCAPLLGGGYANEFNTSFTLVNRGRADARAAIQLLLGNWSLGFQPYLVAQGARVTGNASIIWEVHAAPTDCGPLDVPGPPALALASVDRVPPIDQRALIYATVSPVTTVGAMGGILGGLGLLARRRGISILRDLPGGGWSVAILTAFVASLVAGVVTSVLTMPYNYPPDWTLVLVYAVVAGVLAVASVFQAWKIIDRASVRIRPPSR